MKKKTNSWFRKKCVELAKKAALERDDYTCQKCGKKRGEWQIHASHVFPEGRYHNLSATIINIKALCAYCHMFWWHKHPTEAGEWYQKKFKVRYLQLLELARDTKPKDWEEEYNKLKNI